MFTAALITGVLASLILRLEHYGFRPLEAVTTLFVGVIARCYFVEVGFFAHPDWAEIGLAVVRSRLTDAESVLLAG